MTPQRIKELQKATESSEPNWKRRLSQELLNKEVLKGIFRVGCGHNHQKFHKPSLGPYSEANPKICLDCGARNFDSSERCIPNE